jgi:4-amino-4-deoxy-L-arabinose transferase-like glycosyltransferase
MRQSLTIRLRALYSHPWLLLTLILLVGFGLRIGHIALTTTWGDIYSGDYWWYAEYGSTLVRTGWTFGPPPTGPLFLLVTGYAEQLSTDYATNLPGWLLIRLLGGATLFPDPLGSGQTAIRILHSILGTLTALMVYRIGRAAWDRRVGLIAAAGIALNPIFIIEAGNTMTETIAIFLMTWALALWIERIEQPDWRLMAAAGSLLALAALIRSAFLGFPAVLLLHLLIKHGWRRAIQQGFILVIAFLLTISPWTIYNLVQWDRLTLTGEGLLGMLYVGAVGWQPPDEVDAGLGIDETQSDYDSRQEAFATGFAQTVLSDPAGYIARRVGELANALLQPHNTITYPGESIKTLALTWLRDDRSPGGLVAILQADYFWPKLLLYLFHYTALLGGIVGLVINWRRWKTLLPLYLTIGYFLGMHLVLSAIPRYMFPLEFVWCLFASATLVALLVNHHDQRQVAAPEAPTLQ